MKLRPIRRYELTKVEVRGVKFIDSSWPDKVDSNILSSNSQIREVSKRMDEFEETLTAFVQEMRKGLVEINDKIEELSISNSTAINDLNQKVLKMSGDLEKIESNQEALWTQHKEEHAASKGLIQRIFKK